jgi:hypothetical protein
MTGISINVNGLFPSGAVQAVYELLLDADNDPSTGATVGPFPGIDKIVRVTLNGQFPFTSLGQFTAVLVDTAAATQVPLTPGAVVRIPKLTDVDESGVPSAADYADSVIQTVPLTALGSLANAVPAGIRATDLIGGGVDSASFVFDYNRPSGPQVGMSPLAGDVGTMIALAGQHFTSSSAITILVDDTPVASATSSPAGTFAASFPFPGNVLACDVNGDGKIDRTDINAMLQARGKLLDFFVTARSAAGDSDFSVFTRSLTANDARVCALRCTKPTCVP